jgi:integrase
VGVLPQNPLPKGFIPRRPEGKARQWIYPDEEGQLVASPSVPLWFRVFCGFLAREGLRSEEARTLQWQDLDLKRGIVALDKNKTRDPRMWKLSDGMLEALLAWRTLSPASDKSGRGLVFVDERGQMIMSNNLANNFRDQLRAAGITRELLYKNSAERKHIVMHDLRATFITMALVAGHNEQWVMNQTGHHSSVQINTYKREVDMAMALGFQQLSPLNEAIPELRTRKAGGSAESEPEPSPKGSRRNKCNGHAARQSPTVGPLNTQLPVLLQ